MGLFPHDDPGYMAIRAEEAAMVDASELISVALEANGMTQADLARALKVSRSEITARLRGSRNITVRSLAATLHELGAELELSVRLPQRQQVPAPVELDAYRKWSLPASARWHEDDAASHSHFASMGGR